MQQQFQEEATSAPVTLVTPVAKPARSVVTPENVTFIKAKLNNKDPKVKEAAIETLLGMGQAGIDLLMNVIQEERIKRKVRIRNGITIYSSLMLAFVLLSVFTHGRFMSFFGSFIFILTTGFAVSQAQQQGVLALAKSSDVRAVPFLLEALEFPQQEVKIAARQGLIALLPQLRIEHANMLTEVHRKLLHKCLRKQDFDLQAAILKALEQVGDESSLPILQEILDHPNALSYWRLHEPAALCMDFIHKNIERVHNVQTLLRASQYTEHQDELLRPAYHTDDTPSNELLRPESKPDGE